MFVKASGCSGKSCSLVVVQVTSMAKVRPSKKIATIGATSARTSGSDKEAMNKTTSGAGEMPVGSCRR